MRLLDSNDLPLRRRTLYPTEVRRRIKFFETGQHADMPPEFPSSALELRLRRRTLYPAELQKHVGLTMLIYHIQP